MAELRRQVQLPISGIPGCGGNGDKLGGEVEPCLQAIKRFIHESAVQYLEVCSAGWIPDSSSHVGIQTECTPVSGRGLAGEDNHVRQVPITHGDRRVDGLIWFG